jgi:hypothetical protein
MLYLHILCDYKLLIGTDFKKSRSVKWPKKKKCVGKFSQGWLGEGKQTIK